MLRENNLVSAGRNLLERPSEGNGALPLRSSWIDFVIFLIPALKFFQVNLVGSLYGGDWLVVGLFGLLWRRGLLTPLAAPLPKRFLTLGTLWLISQVVTDIIRETPFHDYARGWAKIVLTLVHFSVLYLLLHGMPRRISIYGWGLVVGSLLTYFLNPFLYAGQYPWEFGWGFPVTLAAFLLTSGQSYRSLLLPAVLAAVNLYLSFRSMAAVCFVVLIYLFLRIAWLEKEGRRQWRAKPRHVVAALVLVALAILGISAAYAKAVSSGLLGSEAQYKYEFQATGDYGLLLGGRSEILLGLMAVYDSPLLGHGSWAKDPDYVAAYQSVLLLLGYDSASFQRGQGIGIDSSGDADYLIGGHSNLLGAWVEAGILGALFWVWVLIIAFRSLNQLYSLGNHLAPLATFCTFWLIWYVCFEPYGGDLRFNTLYYVVLVMSCIKWASGRSVVLRT